MLGGPLIRAAKGAAAGRVARREARDLLVSPLKEAHHVDATAAAPCRVGAATTLVGRHVPGLGRHAHRTAAGFHVHQLPRCDAASAVRLPRVAGAR